MVTESFFLRRLRNTDMRLNSHDNSIEGRFPGSCLG
ncbi:hypothetical protein AO1008_08930 [Aspergillus oryzae 100-8]|uniref:Uncharacterized protein n=1 Tax=Aspergillus oryzae (strain 3.042) TaxID=1160506 RepID=I8IIT1_ASPO3|nr:hypothetical protein Ao3042_04962 [Aspergillus oryzae 3.042]KDE82422.1 hypothetical protein AO1008_08930 [Aspergillus oryzae 100-8]|eukprot:EIT78626.1 hypothetical protein Ao3042_04962 [Aspergillus oryzae 3.042]